MVVEGEPVGGLWYAPEGQEEDQGGQGAHPARLTPRQQPAQQVDLGIVS